MAKAVLELGNLNPFGVNGGHHFVEFLLGSDDDPNRGDDLAGLEQVFADLAELLHGGPEVFDFVAAAGHMLADFIDDEHLRPACSSDHVQVPDKALPRRWLIGLDRNVAQNASSGSS
jgi:hypothetical protein